MPPNPTTSRPDDHFARAEHYAGYAMLNAGRMSAVMFAATGTGDISFLPAGHHIQGRMNAKTTRWIIEHTIIEEGQ
jgi:hypothetical protein